MIKLILIDNRQDKIQVNSQLEDTLKDIISYALKEEKVDVDYEVSVIFIDNESIKELNNNTRNIDRVTDVLSYPMLDYEEGRVYKEQYREYKFNDSFLDEGLLVLGDIALSLERAKEQSIEYGHSFLREVCYLSIHSVLHLLGYDHIKEEDKVKMRKREEEILAKFNIIRD